MGTRPEAIKMAPIILELRRRADSFEQIVLATSQHREMLQQVLEIFGIVPDFDVDLMQHNQGLADYAARALTALLTTFPACGRTSSWYRATP